MTFYNFTKLEEYDAEIAKKEAYLKMLADNYIWRAELIEDLRKQNAEGKISDSMLKNLEKAYESGILNNKAEEEKTNKELVELREKRAVLEQFLIRAEEYRKQQELEFKKEEQVAYVNSLELTDKQKEDYITKVNDAKDMTLLDKIIGTIKKHGGK